MCEKCDIPVPGMFREYYESAQMLPDDLLFQIIRQRFDLVLIATANANHIELREDGSDKFRARVVFQMNKGGVRSPLEKLRAAAGFTEEVREWLEVEIQKQETVEYGNEDNE